MNKPGRKIFTVIIYVIIAAGLPLSVYFISRTAGIFDSRNRAADDSSILTEGPALGQCHWIGGVLGSNPGLLWGYSSSTPFQFETRGGDSWPAIEQTKGVYNFSQIHGEVEYVRNRGKNVWIQIQVADKQNKEHNLPKWLLDQGVETALTVCGNLDHWRNRASFRWDDGTYNSVKPVWNNPKLVDQSEAVLLDQNGNVVTSTDLAYSVTFPTRIAAVWDPLFRSNFSDVLRAMKQEFQPDIDDGTIQAIVMFSGGESGESVLAANCEIWDQGCTPDVLNSSCPVIQSMARIVKKQHYPDLTVDQVATQIISKKSNCDPANIIPGNKVQLCEGQTNCPSEYSSACYVFDDYFIQAMKQMISEYVTIFNPTPVVWQAGSGLSHSGRTTKVLQKWMNDTYGANIWMKFNGWGSRDRQFWSRNFSGYINIGAGGYEPDMPNNFSKAYYQKEAQNWCNMYLTKECKGDESCVPEECKTTPLDTDEIGRIAVVEAIKRGIVEDKSSYLCMQDDFFQDPATDSDGDGLKENKYFFNPDDQDKDCKSSEINVANYGYGFCPGYLNYIMKQNVPKSVSGECIPNCSGKECGSNGCGGSCGTCTTPKTCNSAGICTSGSTLSGDLNGDGKISVSDYALFVADYRSYSNNSTVNPRSDLNKDNKITVSDYSLFIQQYLEYIR